MTDYAEIMQSETFQRLAAFLRVASRPAWLQAHPTCKFGFYFNNFVRHVKSYSPDLDEDIIGDYAGMVSSAVETDVRLAHTMTTDVLDWFISILSDDNHNRVAAILMLVLAVASCEDVMLTPVEAAETTNMSESHWRNRAADGSIPGSQKKGKQWLIPQAWVRFGDVSR